ncbi:MAG: adenosylcobalamin-dependent ribonucleoside-diphosphate reductase [Phycisphaeraceae bacterium]|nr:adenosylcobalamin-dependent ribonucleoside-diphosphate reductase [Phycisphaeraceae bacterium]
MKISRRFTSANSDPFASVKWVKRSSKISNPDGSVVFEMKDAEVPESWSQLATDIMVSKYFRKAGVPVEGGGTGPEKSAKQVIHRLAGCWRFWGEKHGYFDSAADAQAFYDELAYMMVHQICAPNSPQWFNTGLNFAYGISGPAQGHFVADPKTGAVTLASDAYTHPQPHACFIQSVDDDLVGEGGIMDLWVREARLFKYGSGTGTNFSSLRGEGEKLSGGGKSSGLMSWLRIGDRAASAVKSGGTTRRAAKMVCLDMDHPDIETFINWKVREEIKVAAMVEGMKVLKKGSPELAETSERLKLKLDYDFNGEAYYTVSGQNSNNSVRIPDSFFDALDKDGDWSTNWRVSGKVARTFKASNLWEQIGFAAWRCADPGVQFDGTINAWHTCPSAGRINASNPCSEYMFLDNTACNLASLNVLKFYDSEARTFDVERYEHAIDLWTMVLEISVLMAAFPSKPIAELSWKYRTLGLGYANLGAMLMQAGIPYDSEEARALCATLSSILTGRSYRLSALMAAEHGPFPGYGPDKNNMLRVIRNHRLAAYGESRDSESYENLRIRPVPIDHKIFKAGKIALANAEQILDHAVVAWDDALTEGTRYGYRNAQTTVIAPTGTIGLLMDCDTTGVEPDFALVKFKKLAGGGYFKIANESVRPALKALAYSDDHIKEIMEFLLGALHLNIAIPPDVGGLKTNMTLSSLLRSKGVTEDEVQNITMSLPSMFELSFAMGAFAVGEETLKLLGVDPAAARADYSFNLLKHLGLSDVQIEGLNRAICGTQTIEGAPQLKAEHLPVFDCANKCGRLGQRFIAAEGHIRMMAAAQPFISGAISKTINLPTEATVDDIKSCYRLSWELGLKANALYRDGCKLSQPLSATADEAKSELKKDDEKKVEAEVVAGTDEDANELAEARAEVAGDVARMASAVQVGNERVVVETQVQIVHRPMRRRLPDTRPSLTHKFNVAGHEGYLSVGLYEDGRPGELFITMSKEGSTIGGLMDSLGTAVSVALQYGVPVESLVNKFSHQRFEPAGMTENRDIPFAKSLVDYIFRWLGMQFIAGYREAHAPKREPEVSSPVNNEVRISLEHDAPSTGRDPAPGRLTVDTPRSVQAFAETFTKAGTAVAAAKVHLAPAPQTVATVAASALSAAMESLGDAPACDGCGTITVRSGTCYKCLNCGASMGCS